MFVEGYTRIDAIFGELPDDGTACGGEVRLGDSLDVCGLDLREGFEPVREERPTARTRHSEAREGLRSAAGGFECAEHAELCFDSGAVDLGFGDPVLADVIENREERFF